MEIVYYLRPGKLKNLENNGKINLIKPDEFRSSSIKSKYILSKVEEVKHQIDG